MISHSKFKVSIVNSFYYLVDLTPDSEFEIEDMKQLVKADKELGGHKLPVLFSCTAISNTNIRLSITDNSETNKASKI